MPSAARSTTARFGDDDANAATPNADTLVVIGVLTVSTYSSTPN